MTPVAFDPPPTRRVLAPGVAYAAGLICEHRPELADQVREAVLGDHAQTTLRFAIAIAAINRPGNDYQIFAKLADVVHYAGARPRDMQAIVSLLGIMPRLPPSCVWYEHIDGRWRYGHPDNVFIELEGFTPSKSTPPLGAVWAHPLGPGVIGIPHEVTRQWVVQVTAHTVSPDPNVRAAWTRAHLDALA